MAPPFVSSPQQVANRIIGQQHVNHILTSPVTDGLKVQTGTVAVGTVNGAATVTKTVTLSAAYANTAFIIYVTTVSASGTIALAYTAVPASTTTFTLATLNLTAATNATVVVAGWIAVGQ